MTAAAEKATVTGRAWAALSTVRDPELDEPITDLGFVADTTVTGTGIRVRLRLPTYFCAPNFAYLMVADARDALRALGEFDTVDVRLVDHFAAGEINAGVAADSGFTGTFAGEAEDELDELRRTFRRKAHLACLERACRGLVARGWRVDALAGMTLGELPDSPERERLLRRRAEAGLPTGPEEALFVTDDGAPVPADEVGSRLEFARAVRVSVDGNAGWCRGLLATRYPRAEREDVS